MGKIMFKNGIKLLNFNLNNKTIIEPPLTDSDIEDSIIYSVSNKFYNSDKNTLSAIYKLSSFDSNEFAIYRQSPNDSYKTYLGTVNNVSDGIIDYGVASNKQYQYIIQPNPKDGGNVSIQTDYLNVHWNKWSIVSLNYDIENDIYYPDDTIFTFRNNLGVGSISDNMNFIKYNTLDKFGRVMQTSQQYDSGSLTCLFGDFKSVYDIRGSHSLILDEITQVEIRRIVLKAVYDRITTLLDNKDSNGIILREKFLKTIQDNETIKRESSEEYLKTQNNLKINLEKIISLYDMPESQTSLIDKKDIEDQINNLLNQRVTMKNKLITLDGDKKKFETIVSDNIFGYNITINVYQNGNVKLSWTERINNVSDRGYTQDSKDKTTEQIITEIVNMLIDNMPDSFVRRLYCEITYSSLDYKGYYIYFSKYDDYYEKNILWEQVRKQYAYYDDDEKMVLWKQFLQDQKVKLLKSPKGDMWVVSISDQTSRDIQYNSVSYPTTISFNWQEIMDKDKISIMSW